MFPMDPCLLQALSLLFFVVTPCKADAAAASSTSLLKVKLAEARESEEEVGGGRWDRHSTSG
jgi:hypothetical protein